MRRKFRGHGFAVSLSAVGWGCAPSSTQTPLERAENAPAIWEETQPRVAMRRGEELAGAPSAALGAPSDGDLSRPVHRATLERALLTRHPALVASAHRVRTLAAAARAESSLPEPTVMAQVWRVPLQRPYAIDDADMLMFGVEQRFPAPGALGLREDARGHEALAELAMLRARARDLVRELQVAFADYVEATGRHEVHRRHRALLERTVSLAVARSAAGAPATDATQAALELARVDADLAADEGQQAAARARINGLLVRTPGAPLGPPVKTAPPPRRAALRDMVARARASRPEVAAADERRSAAQQMLAASEREGAVPSFGVGVLYFAPVGEMARHGYGVNLSASLPWLWGPRRSEVRTGEAQVRAASADARVVAAMIDADVATAAVLVDAAENRIAILRDVARPAAKRAIDLAEAGYQSGGVDLLRVLAAAEGAVAVESDIVAAEGALERAGAELERALGASRANPTTKEEAR